MSDGTKISWSDASWNPVSGCTEVSPGCAHCYAKTFAERFRGIEGHYYENGFDVQLRPKMLERPLRWKRPRRIFVNSMSDLFHEDVPDEYIAQCFGIMDIARQHTFQLLTKRIERAQEWIEWAGASRFFWGSWPLPNLLIGPTIENQRMADQRLPYVARLKAQGWRTMVSYEPALQLVDFAGLVPKDTPNRCGEIFLDCIDWLICGGESGIGRRPFDHEWARLARDQALEAGVPFFMKQDGALRSEVYDSLPEDLKIREFPQ